MSAVLWLVWLYGSAGLCACVLVLGVTFFQLHATLFAFLLLTAEAYINPTK
ncbi:MAG TPA: hypothetical protein VK404_18590 [Spirosoma sp.]|jgi:hypothetical protein|nr:hypothetical protein [Spirosoma sp.]